MAHQNSVTKNRLQPKQKPTQKLNPKNQLQQIQWQDQHPNKNQSQPKQERN